MRVRQSILGYECVAAKRTQTNNRHAVMETDSETTFMQFRNRTLCLITHASNDTLPRAIAYLHEVSVLQMNKKIEIHLAIEFLQTPLGSPHLLEIFLLLLANHVYVVTSK